MDEEILINKRIDQLPETAGPQAGFFFAMWNTLLQRTERVNVSNFLQTQVSGNFEWISDHPYAEDEVVTRGGKWWQSKINDNENIIPGTDSDAWELLNKSNSLTFWAPGVYPDDNPLVLSSHRGELHFYYLANEDRPYVSLNIETEEDAGDWVQLGKIRTIEVDTTLISNEVTFNCNKVQLINFKESDQIITNKLFLFTNLVEGLHSFARISFDDIRSITFPVGTKMSNVYNASWEELVWTPLEAGKYEMEFTYNNEELHVKMHGPLT